MRIEWATLCDGIEAAPDGPNLLAVTRDAGGVEQLPAEVDPLIAACLTFGLDEAGDGGTVNVRYQIHDPNQQVLEQRTGIYVIGPVEVSHDYPADWPARMILPIHTQFVAAQEGPYEISVGLLGDEPIRLNYYVRLLAQ